MNMHAKSWKKSLKEEPAVGRSDDADRLLGLLSGFMGFTAAVRENAIEEPIRDLIAVRAAQMTGCASCLDIHVRQARIHGEHELRLHHLVAWRGSTLFGPRERAMLAWTEVLIELAEDGIPQDIYDSIRTELSDKEILDLSLVVLVANCWNWLNVGTGSISGMSKTSGEPGRN